MQQYFYPESLNINETISLNDDILYHLKKVLRKDDNYIFRLVDKNHKIFLCHLKDNDKALIVEELNENNELDVEITVILSLIKNDKFELCLQKLVELGVCRIVPYLAQRSIIKGENSKNKMSRYTKIITEAAEQSHRNIIPEITNNINLNEIKNYLGDLNLLAYEKEDSKNTNIDFNNAKKITIIIGPEGGFTNEEIEYFNTLGFNSISLGKRILRAETAAIYLTSLIVGKYQ